jgi:hypothetical protein
MLLDGINHFRDPDGLEGEGCFGNPDARSGALNPPGTFSRHNDAP